MSQWDNFFAAEVGASAALLGLLFVSVSINLSRILSFSALPNRALSALFVPLVVLTVSSLCLAPGQPLTLLGAEILVIGLGVWAATTRFDIQALKEIERDAPHRPRAIVTTFFNQGVTLLYVLSGLVILLNGVAGVYWLVPAILFSFVKAALDAWVLLIEINR